MGVATIQDFMSIVRRDSPRTPRVPAVSNSVIISLEIYEAFNKFLPN